MTVYYTKTATNSWDAHVSIDGTDATPSSGLSLTFDSNGQLETPKDGQLDLASYNPSDGASTMALTLNFSGTTQYGTSYSAAASLPPPSRTACAMPARPDPGSTAGRPTAMKTCSARPSSGI